MNEVQLMIDQITNKIIGYNYIIPKNRTDLVIISDMDEIDKLKNLKIDDNLYYIDGKITEYIPQVDYYQESKELEVEYSLLKKQVENERDVFMDNIMNGMDIIEATEISKQNRLALEENQKKREQFEKKVKEDLGNAIVSKFLKEEENIEYKYYLSMLAVVRDENAYLEEWITWHIEKHDFDHFYIYDNESEIPVKTYLESVNFPYMDKLTIIEWVTSNWTQQDAYNDFLKNYKDETKWMIATDPDELVYVKDEEKTLVEFLKENEKYAAIKCLWVHYNANGHETKPEGTMYENYTVATTWDDYKHGGKRFAQTNRIARFGSYVPQIRLNAPVLDYTDGFTTEFFQLNHYYTKSYEEWVAKIKRGSSNPHFRRKYSEFFELNPDMEYLNIGEDYEQGYGSANTENTNETTGEVTE